MKTLQENKHKSHFKESFHGTPQLVIQSYSGVIIFETTLLKP